MIYSELHYPKTQQVFYYKQDNVSHKLIVEYGFVPEFPNHEQSKDIFKVRCTLKHKVGSKWEELSFGLLKGSVMTHASHLKHIFRWHCRYRTGLPIHYVENALIYYDTFQQTKDGGVLKTLINHIGYLDLPNDHEFEILAKQEKAILIKWLQERAPKLKALMEFDLGLIYNPNSDN